MLPNEDIDDDRSVFTLVPTDSQDENVPKTQVSFRLQHTDPNTGLVTYAKNVVRGKFRNEPVFRHTSLDIAFSTEFGENEAFLLMPFEIVSVAKRMQELVSTSVFLNKFNENTANGGLDKMKDGEIKRAQVALLRVVNTVQIDYGKTSSSDMPSSSSASRRDDSGASVDVDSISPSLPCSTTAQTCARELKMLDLIFAIGTLPLSHDMDTTYDPDAQVWKDRRYARIANLVTMAWRTLQVCFNDNRVSETYFAKKTGWISSIIKLVADPIGAAIMFEALIRDNGELLSKYVNNEVINEFKDLIIKKGMQPRLIRFFVSM